MSVNWVYEKVNKEFQFFLIKTWSLKAFPHPLKNTLESCVSEVVRTMFECLHKNETLVMGKYLL